MKKLEVIEKASPKALFRKLAIPNMISGLVMMLYSIVDGIFVGRIVGVDALAAVNLCMPILGFVVSVIYMVSIGSAVQISMKLGAKKQREASEIFTFSIIIQVVYAMVIMVLGVIFVDDIIALFGVDEVVAGMAYDYIIVFLLLSPIFMLGRGLSHYVRASGWAIYSMVVSIISAILNIILDYVFLVPLGMGIRGAALASCIAITVAAIMLISPFLAHKMPIKFVKPRLMIKEFGVILFNGSSEFFTNISTAVTGAIVNYVIIGIAGDQGMAAVGIILYIESIVMAILFGMGDAFQPPISFSYGSQQYKRLWAIFNYSLKVGFFISMAVFMVIFFANINIASLFIGRDDVALLKLSNDAIKIFIFSFPFNFINILASLFFTAINKPKESIVISVSNTFIFKVAGILILPSFFGIIGVWLALVMSSVVSFIISVVLLAKHYRKMKFDENKVRSILWI